MGTSKMKKTGPTNPITKNVLAELRENKSNWAKAVEETVSKPRRNRPQVNLSRINRIAKDETIVVPGKVLGSGTFDKKVTVAALEFSDSARKKINATGKAITLSELLISKASKVRVVK